MSKGHCKCKSAECEECPEWIFTFADLVMLMMGFFVILWVTKPSPNPNTGEAAKTDDDWLKVAAAVREAFGYVPDPNSRDPVDVQMLMQKLHKLKPLNGEGEGGRTKVKRDGAEGIDEKVTSVREGSQSVVGGRLIFEAGKAELLPDTQKALGEIAEQIRGHRNIVLVKGHASLDDMPDSSTPQQRMDLSLRRAQKVADYLTTLEVEPDVIRVLGCSTFEPVRQRVYGDNAQSSNRRVEVQATNVIVRERQDPSPGTRSAPEARPTAAAAAEPQHEIEH